MTDAASTPAAAVAEHHVDTYAEVVAVLCDQDLTVPTAPAGAGGLAWLQATVSRFANGADHDRRRRLVERILDRISPGEARRAVRERTAELLDRAAGPVDVMALIARPVPIGLLATAVGAGDDAALTVAVADIAAAYHLGAPQDRLAAADRGVDELVTALGCRRDEATAARIAVLVQACEPVAGLIGNTLAAVLQLPADVAARHSVDSIVREALRWDPPVRSTVRAAVGAGRTRVDLAAANRDPARWPDPHRFDPGRAAHDNVSFGAGRRPCPAQTLAVELASGVVEVVSVRCVLSEPHVEYEPSTNQRVPRRLLVDVVR